jgi:hypothetical protein
MKHALTYTVAIIRMTIALVATSAFAQTNAAGPYYAIPSWDQQLGPATRFIVLSNWSSAAVLDRETGLVWEKSPSSAFTEDWYGAQSLCNALKTGGRLGWRLPTLQELASLVDPSVPFPGPTLPAGHPFANVQSSSPYWSATSAASNANLAWATFFSNGGVGADFKNNHNFFWCVRGGQGVDAQ